MIGEAGRGGSFGAGLILNAVPFQRAACGPMVASEEADRQESGGIG